MIIITRPSPYGEELTQLCNEANFSAKHLPLFKIEKGADIDNLQSHLERLKPNDIVIITSPQVPHLINAQKMTIRFPSHLNYFAIGHHTASLFKKLSKQPVQFPKYNENSEGMITHLKNIELPIDGHQILILCGDVGRTLIKNTLESQGGLVKNIHIYKRQPMNYQNSVLNDDGIIDKNIVITSVEHLLQLESYCNEQQKKQYKLIVSGIRIVKEAKLRGWRQVHLARNANNQNLFKTITTLCHNATIN